VFRDSTDPSLCTYILSLELRTVCRFAHRETDVGKFFCECVNRSRTHIERRCAYEPIKFNDLHALLADESLNLITDYR
jgi:hypothetical protein